MKDNQPQGLDRRGQTLVEFALILPLLMVVILGVIEFGRLLYGFSTLQNAARHAADFASKSPPHLGERVPGDPLGRVYAIEEPDCGQDGEEPCYLANIRAQARRYAVLFPPQDPNIHIYFLPVKGIVSNDVGGLVEVQIEYSIMPITPVLKDMAPLGVPVVVGSRRTIVNINFPAEELLTPIAGTPSSTPLPTEPVPGCGGLYTMQGEAAQNRTYEFQITNVSAGNGGDGLGRGIVGLIIGWCPGEMGQLLSVTVGGVDLLPGPSGTGSVSLPGGSVRLPQGETMYVVMTFQHPLTGNSAHWPSWHLTFDDYCMLWSTGERNCPFPTGTPLPSLTPTETPQPTGSPTPWPSGTIPPLCGMYIQDGPIFAYDQVRFDNYNGGSTAPDLDAIVVMWGPGWQPLKEIRWAGQTVWSGTKYYSTYVSGLNGDFPPDSLRRLEFVFDSGPINWLSFQAVFDNNCHISYSDPTQPTPPPMPTYTPTPVIGWIYLDVSLDPEPPACASDSLNAQAIAYYPPAGYEDGKGIQRVEFRVLDPSGTQVHFRSDTGKPYCLTSSCAPLALGTKWPSGAPVISGTHSLEVTAYTTSGWGSYQRTESFAFEICRQPLHVEVLFAPSGCATTAINVQTIAWDPAQCGGACQDGAGISRVYFDVYKEGDLVYSRNDGSVCYCASNSGCCNDVNFSSGRWPVSNTPVSSGTHTLVVRVQASSGRIAEVSQGFCIDWDPCTPYQLHDEYKQASKRVRVQIRNYSNTSVYVTGVHVSDWPSSVWGRLTTMRVIGLDRTVNADNPPVNEGFFREFVGDSTSKALDFNFLNNIGDFNPADFSGYIELDNGCRIDF